MTTPNNTPETTTGDKCPHCGAEFKNYFGNFKTPFTRWECLTTSHGSTRTPLCIEREARKKAEAELSCLKIENERLQKCVDADSSFCEECYQRGHQQ